MSALFGELLGGRVWAGIAVTELWVRDEVECHVRKHRDQEPCQDLHHIISLGQDFWGLLFPPWGRQSKPLLEIRGLWLGPLLLGR